MLITIIDLNHTMGGVYFVYVYNHHHSYSYHNRSFFGQYVLITALSHWSCRRRRRGDIQVQLKRRYGLIPNLVGDGEGVCYA